MKPLDLTEATIQRVTVKKDLNYMKLAIVAVTENSKSPRYLIWKLETKLPFSTFANILAIPVYKYENLTSYDAIESTRLVGMRAAKAVDRIKSTYLNGLSYVIGRLIIDEMNWYCDEGTYYDWRLRNALLEEFGATLIRYHDASEQPVYVDRFCKKLEDIIVNVYPDATIIPVSDRMGTLNKIPYVHYQIDIRMKHVGCSKTYRIGELPYTRYYRLTQIASIGFPKPKIRRELPIF